MHLIVLRTLLVCLLMPIAAVMADDPPPAAAPKPQSNPLSAHNRMLYGALRQILIRSAEKMPEEYYSFKPTDVVRSFGQIVGHIADAQYLFCSTVLGEKYPALKIEKTKTSKAELIAALEGAFTYCDKAYDGMNDTSGAQLVKFMGGEAPKLGVLNVNQTHAVEHYGNLVTYMRMKNVVPPTSEPEFMQQMRPLPGK